MSNTADAARTELTARMMIPTTQNPLVAQFAGVIRAAILNNAFAAESAENDAETLAKKGKKAADTALATAYTTPRLNEQTAKTLRTRTGMDHAQLTQFTPVELGELRGIVQAWFPAASKAAAKKEAGEYLIKAQGSAVAIGADLFQILSAAGVEAGTRVTVTMGKKHHTLSVNMGGKTAYSLHNTETGVTTKADRASYTATSKNSMVLGRARRIARELVKLAGDRSKLGKADAKFYRDNAATVDEQFKRLTQSALPAS